MRVPSPAVRSRCGTIVPMFAICLIAIFSFVALAIDLGLMMVAKTQCQNAADIAALSGARSLDGKSADNNRSAAVLMAKTAARNNTVLSSPLQDANVTVARTGVFRYSESATKFVADFETAPASNEGWSAMQVSVRWSEPGYFSRIFGVTSMNVQAIASAVHRPRDLAIVLDFSSSMRFSSELNYSNASALSSLNPDSRFPRMGPWSIFDGSGMVLDAANLPAAPSDLNAYTPTTPFQRVFPFVDTGGETHAINNHTTKTANGPPIVENFLQADNATSAFVRSAAAFPTLPNVRVGTGGYPTTIVTPAPDAFATQTGANFAGDRFPLRSGIDQVASAVPKAPDYAHTVQEYLTGSNAGATATTRNATFETEGATGGYDWDFATSAAKPTSKQMQGFTMGPGYYGKTFYMWPPDPRTPVGNIGDVGYVPGDWRRRFYTPRAGSTQDLRDNSVLWDTLGKARLQNPGPTANYLVDYNSVLAWLRKGPQTMPTDGVRAGRVVYYDAMPTAIPVDANTGMCLAGATEDQRFWKDYIDFVMGVGRWNPASCMFGVNAANSNAGGGSTVRYSDAATPLATKITTRASLVAAAGLNPVPYVHYGDNPIHPRANFWFGPVTFMAYLERAWNWYPGTCYEAHCWQLKAGINSALTDIQNNHPNDLATLIYFSSASDYNVARVGLSNDYARMKNALFFPYSLLDRLGDRSATVRPYTALQANVSTGNPSGVVNAQTTDIPNAFGGTTPEMALKVAYNQFGRTTGFYGRRGAAKVTIFETDGVPIATASATLTSTGGGSSGEWYYSGLGPVTILGTSTSLHVPSKDDARAVVRQIVALDTAATPGFSTVRSPARVHAIAFGQLFEPSTISPMRQAALSFLTALQIDGNTTAKPAGNWDTDSLDSALYSGTEPYKVITGDYNARIDKLRQAMERITQGGVPIALIQ